MRKKIKKIAAAAMLLAPEFVFAQAPPSPIQNVSDIVKLFSSILYWVSSIFWIAAGIATLYAGFLYMTAGGDDQQVQKAKKQLLYAIIAIAIGLIGPGLTVIVNNFLGGQ